MSSFGPPSMSDVPNILHAPPPLISAYDSLQLGLPIDWFVVRLKTSREYQACRQLESRGLTYLFLPTYTEYRRYLHWGKPHPITRTLFPGYAFIKFSARRPILRTLIESTPGVIGLLQIAPGHYAIVEDQTVQDLWRLAMSGQPLAPHPILQPGARCRVIRGPLTGVEGLLMRYRDQWRVVLNVGLLGRACSVALDREAVTKC